MVDADGWPLLHNFGDTYPERCAKSVHRAGAPAFGAIAMPQTIALLDHACPLYGRTPVEQQNQRRQQQKIE
jgi:hypothetical protein